MPSGRGEDAEFWADENEFVFSSRPYFLRLHLPGPVIEDGREHSAFDWSTNELKISIPKKVSVFFLIINRTFLNFLFYLEQK